MTADRSCTARFEREPARRLLVVRTGSGTGRVTGTPAGDPGAVDCGQLCTVVYDRSTLVTLTAVPDENSVFAGWSGACSGSAATTDVLVEAADYSCTARFELELRTLTARAGGTGTGSVASAPGGIACGDDCTEQYPHGTTVRLTATPDAGSAFVGWTGDCVGSEPGTLVTMDADKACTALFTSAKFTLTVQPTGDGRGGVTSGPAGIACGDAGQDCAELYPEGTTVTLTAQPGASSVFVEWGGACAGEVVTVTVFMNANKTCTAEFRVGVDTVLVFKSGSGKGTVTSNPPGIDCGPDCDYQYEGYVKGTVVTLTAAPAQGSRFVEWSGDCVANGATATVTLDGHDRACTARFDSALPKTLTVVPTGSGSGSVSSLPLGISCGNVCASLFEDGSRVDLTALPVTGSRFVSWGNACSGSEPFASVTMDADKTCSARFDLIAYTLRVTTVGSATGTVTSAPPGIVCGAGGSDCAEPYAYRTAVTLTATPGPNARFTGWSGDCSGSDAATGVLMDADRACTAQFDLVLHTLAVTWGGSGTGRVASAPGGIDCGNDCAEQFVHGTTVALTALPDEGSTFTGWTGDCVGTAPGTLVTLDADRGCTALFDRVSFRLTAARAGAGAGSVVSTPAGIECGSVCSAPYAPGTPVTLVATPAQGSAFTGWSGSCSGSAPAAAVTMNADLACTAEFNVATYQLTVTVSGSGAGGVASAPEGIGCGNGAQDCEETYLYQTTVTLTATPAPGSMFGEWSGACAGSAPVATVAMDAARTCDARFDPATRTLTVGFTGGGSGQVASAPPGIDCRPGGPASVCTSSFDYGATVTLTAVPATGSSFVQWSADCVGSAPATTVAMDANRICLAQFEVITYTLRVTRVGSADGSVTSDPAGIGCGNACSAEYAHGTTVTLTAAPAENAVFTTWRVGCVGTAPGTTVTLTANTDCEAQFDLALRALTVTKSGAGGGRVTSAPGGVDCGSDCAEPYAHGTTVVLTAVPDENSFFLGWSGACAGSAPAASVTMDADKACDAQFDKLALRRLSLTKSGDGALAGTVTSTPPGITCGSICAADFPQGAQVTLTGSPAAPAFASWSGNAAGCSGTSPSVTVTLGAADATCDARFNRTITATVSTAGTGTGTIRTSNGQINCPDICTGIFAASTIIAFTATPAPGSMFTGWSGGNCFGTSTTATVFASAPVTCTATFTSTVGMTLRLLSSRDYGERVEAATLGVGSFLISSGEDGAGTLTSINFSNPSSPFVTASVPDYCFGAQSLFMLQQTTNSFMATSPGTGLGCVNKLAPAQTTLVDFGFTPGSGALIPGSSPNVAAGYAVADVGGGALEVRLTGQAPLRIPLAGTPRSCPWDVLVTSLLYLVVGREGVAGTPTEGCGSRGQLYIVNRSTSQVTGTVELGAAPRGIILSPDRLSAYIADAAEDRVYVVNLNARTVSRTIDVGDGPTSVALFPDGSHMVVTNRSTNRVQIVDVRTGAVMGDAPSNGSRPARVFITPDGGCVVVLNYGADGGAGNASFFAPQFSTAGTISAASARH
ncbi:MAG TPA: hypothetical protein VKA84_27735 [Gemmatimonadaceae bacterium]|nr:hypothetical protein [Gemmatimonadaceae bacterium]